MLLIKILNLSTDIVSKLFLCRTNYFLLINFSAICSSRVVRWGHKSPKDTLNLWVKAKATIARCNLIK